MKILDYIFGWLIPVSTDATIISMGLVTSMLLILVRKFTTNQNMLAKINSDLKRLAFLISKAKVDRDTDALCRYRKTKAQIAMLKLREEIKPLLFSLVPVIFIASWGFLRLQFKPLEEGDRVKIVAKSGLSDTGEIVWLVPDNRLIVEDGWIRKLTPSRDFVEAVWFVTFKEKFDISELKIRRLNNIDKPISLSFCLKELRFLGIVPSLPFIKVPAWMVGYLISVVILFILFKRMFKIY